MQTSLPVAERPRRPEWMKVRAPSANRATSRSEADPRRRAAHHLRGGPLSDIAECWGRGTAPSRSSATPARAPAGTATCTPASPRPADPLEPLRLAQTAAQMGLEHVVVTSVDRDDLPDRGAATTRRRSGAQAKLPSAGRGAPPRLPRPPRRMHSQPSWPHDRRLQPQHRDGPAPAPEHAWRQGHLRRGTLVPRHAKEIAACYPIPC